MPRKRKSDDLDTAKGILGMLFLLGCGGYVYRHQIAELLGWLLIALPVFIILFGGLLFLVVRLRKKSVPDVRYSPGVETKRSDRPYFSPCEPAPESSFAPRSGSLSTGEEPSSAASDADIPGEFTEAFLKQLEWRSFEQLIEALFRTMNLSASRLRAGADGGVDLELRNSETGALEGIVQCKAWNSYSVGVKPVRELYGVMCAEGAPHGYFVCTGRYTKEALDWINYKPMTLIDGPRLLQWLNSLPQATVRDLLAGILASDFTTPTCPSCDKKMVRRASKHGEFWGCASYPRCRFTMKMAVAPSS